MFAAIREKFLPRTCRAATSRKVNRTQTLRIEALEERTLLTAQPFVFTTLHEGFEANGAISRTADFGGTTNAAQTTPLLPMMDTVVQGKLSSGADVDMFRISLLQGQIFTADADGSVIGLGRSIQTTKLSLLDSHGSVLTAVGTARNGQSLEYRVPQGGSGVYFVKVADSDPASTQALSYTLHLRPVGLDAASFNASNLSRTGGGLYAWLDNTAYANGSKVLDISGPVGHGFGIRANWTETVSYSNGLPGASYTTTGIPVSGPAGNVSVVYLESPLGEVPIPVPAGDHITITTKAQQWGDAFGEIGSVDWIAPPSLTTAEAVLGVIDPLQVLPNLAIAESTKLSIGLGTDTAVQNTGAPANAAIPYLYFTVNPLSSVHGGSVTQALSIVLDPADPYLFINSPLTGDATFVTAIGASQHGLIPFTPDAKPSQWNGSLHGHLYVEGELDTTALTEVPSQIEGNLTINLDPNNTGHPFGGATAGQILGMFADPGLVNAFDPATAHLVMTNFSAGLNGELKISPFEHFAGNVPDAVNRLGNKSSLVDFVLNKELPKVLTVGEASLVYDGPTESTYFHGHTPDPFADTPLAPFTTPVAVDIDAAVKPGGAFYLDAKGAFQFVGLTGIGGEIKIENNWPTTVLGFMRDSHGAMVPTAQIVYVSSITADVQVFFGIPDVIRATLDINFSLSVDSLGRLNYSGSGTASVDLYEPDDGWNITDWTWQTVGSVGVGVTNDDMWFEVNGQRYDFDLPH